MGSFCACFICHTVSALPNAVSMYIYFDAIYGSMTCNLCHFHLYVNVNKNASLPDCCRCVLLYNAALLHNLFGKCHTYVMHHYMCSHKTQNIENHKYKQLNMAGSEHVQRE